MAATLTNKAHISECKAPGDYSFVLASDGWHVNLACPFCGLLAYCSHQIIQKDPLTLAPSVQMPSKVQHPCGHHFFIQDGKVK